MVNSLEARPPEMRAAVPPWPSLTFRRWLWLAYALSWTVALLVPLPFQAEPGTALAQQIFTFSKSLHVLAYTLFTVLAAWMWLPRTARLFLLLGLYGHAMLTEFLQWVLHDLTHRTGQWSDVALDSIGVTLGVIVAWKWWWRG